MAKVHSVTCSHAEASQAVDELVQNIHTNLREMTGIIPAEVIKGGSLGQGTAIPGDFDLDLIIYTNSITEKAIVEQRYNLRYWVEKLETFLVNSLGDKYQPQGSTDNAVQFIYNEKIGVDLLLSPNWPSLIQFYSFLRSVPCRYRTNFTVCTARWQAELFQKQIGEEEKELVRRLKAWRNAKYDTTRQLGGKPKSYFLSLLTLNAYKKVQRGCRKQANFEERAILTTNMIKTIVRSSANRRMNITWDGLLARPYYRRRDYPSLNCSRPRVMDPVNPWNNLYMSGLGPANNYGPGDGRWSWLVANIDTLDLSKPVKIVP